MATLDEREGEIGGIEDSIAGGWVFLFRFVSIGLDCPFSLSFFDSGNSGSGSGGPHFRFCLFSRVASVLSLFGSLPQRAEGGRSVVVVWPGGRGGVSMNRSFGLGASAPTGLATARRDAFDPESSSRTGAERKRVRVEEARSFNDQRFIGAGGAGGVAAAAVATAAAHRLVWKPISCVIERSPEQCRMSLGMTVEVIRSTAVATARIEKCLG